MVHAVFGLTVGIEHDCGKRFDIVEQYFVCRAAVASLLDVRQRFVSVHASSSQYDSTTDALWPTAAAAAAATRRRSLGAATAAGGGTRDGNGNPQQRQQHVRGAPSLGTLLAAVNASDIAAYSSSTRACGQPSCTTHRYWSTAPLVFAVALLWDTDEQGANGDATTTTTTPQQQQQPQFVTALDLIDRQIQLSDVLPVADGVSHGAYYFRGFVAHSAKSRFVSVFASDSTRDAAAAVAEDDDTWLLTDDGGTVVIRAWSSVVALCARSQIRPILLYYERNAPHHCVTINRTGRVVCNQLHCDNNRTFAMDRMSWSYSIRDCLLR